MHETLRTGYFKLKPRLSKRYVQSNLRERPLYQETTCPKRPYFGFPLGGLLLQGWLYIIGRVNYSLWCTLLLTSPFVEIY